MNLWMKRFAIIILIANFASKGFAVPTNLTTIDLNHNWQFRQADKNDWLPATVPGTVHTDLFNNEKIGDPFYRTNERNQQWIDKVDWEYKNSFNVDKKLLSRNRIELLFKGLDTYADVYLNGAMLLSADNMFRAWKVDCKSLLKEGENELRIYFHSPVKIDLPKLEQLGYQLPAVNDQSENGALGDKKISIFARKAGYHYGWDWGPRFVTSGIWRPIQLVAWDKAKIENIKFIQTEVTKQSARINAVFEVESVGDHLADLSIKLKNETKIQAQTKTSLKPGMNRIAVEFEIKNPKLWWSNGLGEPNLYSFISELKIAGSLLDKNETRIGIRTIKVYLSIDASDGFFTDNYFDLLPGEEVAIDFLTTQKSTAFEKQLKIISLGDSY